MATEYQDVENSLIEQIDRANETRAETGPKKSHVICVASGKGGTGKTIVSTNLALCLADKGLNVALLDADFGLANAHLLMGLDPTHDISSVVSGEKNLADIMLEGPNGVKLIPGGSGLSELTTTDHDNFKSLINELGAVENYADLLIIDLSAGISPQVMCFLAAAHEKIIVTTPEVTSLVDAYAMIKSISKISQNSTIRVIVNKAADKSRAAVAFQKLCSVTHKHLNGRISLKYLGWLPQNWYILNSVACRKPVVMRHPKSFAAACLTSIAEKISAIHSNWNTEALKEPGRISYFEKLEKTIYGG